MIQFIKQLLIGLGVAIFGASLTCVQPSAGAQEPKATDKNPTASRKDGALSTARTAVGTVKSAVADAVVVAGKEVEWTFAIGATTKVGKVELKPGDQVRVRYVERDGKSLALDIAVISPAKPKGAASPAGKK